MESKPPLMTYSVVLGLMVLFQFYFIYVTFNANALLSQDQATIKDKLSIRIEGINLYLNDENFRGNWNTIQENLRCCGFTQDLGEDWTNLHGDRLEKFLAVTENRCYPESCCIRNALNSEQCKAKSSIGSHEARCKKSIGSKLETNEIKRINVRTCPEVLQEMYTESLPNLFTFIEIHGGLTILIEVIAIALSSAFVAQITRRSKRYHVGIEMD